jgi:hypothetical protein
LKPDPKILFDHRPDPLERKIRAVCGSVLGTVIALSIWIHVFPLGVLGTTLLFAIPIVGCAWGAMKYGDDFWHSVVPWLRGF